MRLYWLQCRALIKPAKKVDSVLCLLDGQVVMVWGTFAEIQTTEVM